MNKKIEAIWRGLVSAWPLIKLILILLIVCGGICWICVQAVKVDKTRSEAPHVAFTEEFKFPYPTNEADRVNARPSVVAILSREREVAKKTNADCENLGKLIQDLPRTTVDEIDQYLRIKDQRGVMDENNRRQQAYYYYLLRTAYSAGFWKETEAIAGYRGPNYVWNKR